MNRPDGKSAQLLNGQPDGEPLPEVLDPAWVDEQGVRFAGAVEQVKLAMGADEATIDGYCRDFRAALEAVSRAIGRPYP